MSVRPSVSRTIMIGFLLANSSQALPADWEWTIAPYLWAADTSLDISIADRREFDGSLGFDDLVDNLDFAAQLHAEGRRGHWGLLADATYLKTSDGKTVQSAGPLGAGEADIDTDAALGIYELGGFFRPMGDGQGLDLLAGVRLIDFEQEVSITPSRIDNPYRSDISSSLTDFFVGLRYQASLTDSLSLVLRGDYGSGDTESTWNALGMLAWRMGGSDHYQLLLGYRYLEIELEEEKERVAINTDLSMHGPVLGFAFRF